MSNPITSVDPRALEAVTGGAASQRSVGSSSDLLSTLNSLSSTLKNLGTASKTSGFSTTEILMLGFLMTQNRNQINVFVRRPYW
jgi:hypothetical protein